eukprot:1700544-Pyramimonas_sp.AAC.1
MERAIDITTGQRPLARTGDLHKPRIITSPRAELYAVVQILRSAMLPLTIYADYLDLHGGLARGPSWGVEDLGGLGSELQILHVSGHQKGMSFEARGNRWADFAPTQGRDLHSVRESDARFMKRLYKTTRKSL